MACRFNAKTLINCNECLVCASWLLLLLVLPVGCSPESGEKVQPGPGSQQSTGSRAGHGQEGRDGGLVCPELAQSSWGAVAQHCGSPGWMGQRWLRCEAGQGSAFTGRTGAAPRVTRYVGMDTLKYLPLEILPPLPHFTSGLLGGCKSLPCHAPQSQARSQLALVGLSWWLCEGLSR